MKVFLALLLAVSALRAADEVHNTAMYVDPAKGEAPSKGKFHVYHAGEGELPTEGYFKKHEPGEIAEYHLFVPDGLDKKKLYPLLIVYHGGKDGGSGKGLCRSMSRLSTKKHPIIVLSPNMYTMDAYNELLKEGKLPIDTRRVAVFGFSSGGMGVRSAMEEFVRSKGRFKPALLVSASTTASMGGAEYPQVPYVVMAGEKETAEYIKHPALKTRRTTCRKHALAMQKVIKEVRYIEMKGQGHSAGKPEHRAVLMNLLRAIPSPGVDLRLRRTPAGFEALVDAVEGGDWAAARAELKRLDGEEKPPSGYAALRRKIDGALDKWTRGELKAIRALGKKSGTSAVTRGLAVYDNLKRAETAFADTKAGEKLGKALKPLAGSKFLQRELDARRRYYEVASAEPSESLRKNLEALLAELPDTEFGGRRTKEKLLALSEFG